MPRKTTPAGECPDDKILNWIDVLKNASRERNVMVQHKRDGDVLKSLGVRNVYFEQEPEFKTIEQLENDGKECLLVYDATHAGNTACARMRSKLEHRGVKVSTRMRKILFTSACKELGGFLKYIHAKILPTERKHGSKV